MGKFKKIQQTDKDEGQKKISSFFQKPSSVTKPSGLFTQLGQKSGERKRQSADSACKEIIEIGDDTDFKPPKFNKDLKEFAQSRLERALKQSENVRKAAWSDGAASCHPEVTVVPETQLPFSPEGKGSDALKENVVKCTTGTFQSPASGASDVSDLGIIPDTPDNETTKAKRPLGRSFLLSSSHFGSNPIQEAKENREAKIALKRKRASLARKSLVSVSVKFNSESDPEKKPENIIQTTEGQDTKTACPENGADITDEVKDIDDDLNGREATPTKIYSNGASLKRMAKLGDSPDSKRTAVSLDVQTADTKTDIGPAVKNLGFDHSASEELVGRMDNEGADKTLEIEEMNAKAAALIEDQEKKAREKQEKLERERQQRMERKKKMIKEEKKKNSEKMLKYQLSGNAGSASSGKTETVLHDDTLDDLLQELHSPSLLKTSKTSDSKHGKMKKTSSSVSASTKEVKKSTGTSDSGNKCKRYSLEGVLVEGRRESDVSVDISELKHNDTSMASDLKSGSKAGKDTNEISMEWTEDDEKYFAELGVKTDKSASRVSNGIMLNTSDISKPTAGSSKHKLVTIKQLRKENNSGKNKHQQSNNKTVKHQTENVEITDFPTQCCQATEKSRIPHQEIDIDEFGTQAESMFGDFDEETESQQICQQLETMSPFKRDKCEKSNSVFQSHTPCTGFSRHLVTEVHHDRAKQEMILEITSQPSAITRKCILHGFWLDTVVEKGDIVNVLAEFTDGVCNITDKHGLLIVNPDLLISGTTVVSSMFCMRKSILKEKFKGCDSRNIQMLYGSIIHSVFQQVLKKKLVTEKSVLQEAETIINQASNLMEMYANKVSEDKVLEEIKSYIPQIMSWTKQYTNIGQDIIGNQRQGSSDVTITKVKDIEENIWSPRFGVKGKIDLTVEVKIKNEKKKSLLPLELKTGKVSYSDEHKGQVTLYSMMSADRREDPNKGLLLYLKEPSMRTIPADHVHKKGLTQLRNEMAHYISRQVVKTEDETGTATYTLGRLPEPISNVRACQKCPQLINCAIHQREIEGRTPSGLVTDTLQHLTASHMTYFIQWCLMLDLEAKVDQSKRTIADIWCLSSGEREDVGMCLGGMTLTKDWKTELAGDDTVILSFTRHSDNKRKTAVCNVGLNPQDNVVVSCEKPSWIAVCTGFVHSISPTGIQVITDSDVIGRMQTLQNNVFRLDKSDSFSTAGMLYTNLSRLMTPESSYERLRHLIIDTVKPEFAATLSKGNLEKVKSIFKVLNKPQKTAVLKVLMCKDYVLIKGYPGTGKTSTIVALVKILHLLGLSVLLTSYTHSAVDNILLKLKKDRVQFLRLGRLAKIHSEIQEYSADRLTRDITNTADLETFLHSQMIVATSCLGTTHPLFSRRQFDVCIVDEASQVLQPACLGPLFSSKRFVLVGDPKQLPPVVQSKEAKKLGMAESLFARLDGRGATFELNLQYRMNKEIVSISNLLVYKGCLQCGSETVANRTLHIPAPDRVQTMVDCSPWLAPVLDTSLDKSVVFLDTQQVPAPESKDKGGVVKNYTEANIVMHIVSTLIKAGVLPEDIGIIAPYRSQVFLLRNLMNEGQGQSSEVEVNTVDQYQGRDKNVIIISFVRSSRDGDTKTGELLKDVRRLNVAVTRAKTKLVLIGDIAKLRQYQPLQEVIDLCNTRQQVISLPKGAVP